VLLRDEVDGSHSARWIAVGREDAFGLVEQVINVVDGFERLAIDADLLATGFDAGAQLGDRLAIHFDAAGEDQFLAFAAAAQPAGSEDFLQADGACGFVIGDELRAGGHAAGGPVGGEAFAVGAELGAHTVIIYRGDGLMQGQSSVC